MIANNKPTLLIALSLPLLCAVAGCHNVDVDQPVGSAPSALIDQNGLRMNGLGANGVGFNNINLNGLELNGATLNGATLNGATLNGATLNGATLNGATLNGATLNGATLNGATLNGATLNGIDLAYMTLDGNPVDASTEALALLIVRYLAECALSASQSLEVHDLSGQAVTYHGVEGLDPGWSMSAPDLTRSDEVGQCFVDRASQDGHDAYHVAVNLEAIKQILPYLVECAVPAGESVTMYDEHDDPFVLHGAFGLAPEWRIGPVSAVGEKRVSACLGARSNARQQPVLISIRGQGIAVDANEIDLFETQEAGFMGNLFGAQPAIKTCLVDGGGLSGRVCAEGAECGFTSIGDCATECATRDSVDGTYSDCDGHAEVINTFLNLGREVGFGEKHNCWIKPDRTLWCWGRNLEGQLGRGTTSAFEAVAQQVPGLEDVVQVMAGVGHTCARTAQGEAYCWGLDDSGQIGDGAGSGAGPGNYVSSPYRIDALGSDVAMISALRKTTCALKTDASLYCWGENSRGEVGDGTFIDRSQPVAVNGLGAMVTGRTLGARARATCAIMSDGSLQCWGANDAGQVGDGTTVDRNVPTGVTTDEFGQQFADVTDVCGGARHSCARKSDGTVWCWGSDSSGQLGNGQSAGDSLRPSQVDLPVDVAPNSLSCGDDHVCAISENSDLYCWGDNVRGQMGDGSTTQRQSPVAVTSLGNQVALVTAVTNRTCAYLIDGSLYCFGDDSDDLFFPAEYSAMPIEVDLD